MGNLSSKTLSKENPVPIPETKPVSKLEPIPETIPELKFEFNPASNREPKRRSKRVSNRASKAASNAASKRASKTASKRASKPQPNPASIGASKAASNTTLNENLPEADPGMFAKELEFSFVLRHKYKDPYIPLFLIQAHSIEPESDMFDLPEGIDILHYCKKGCILRTKRIKKNSQDNPRNHSELNTDFRSISMEYACLKQLEIYDRYEKKCPPYQFSIDEAIKKEGGIYLCLDKKIHKIFTFKSGYMYPMHRVIELIKDSTKSTRIHIGILACRRIEGCTDVVVALPGSPSQHANMLNPKHNSHRRTFNKNGEEARQYLPAGFNINYRQTKRKRSH